MLMSFVCQFHKTLKWLPMTQQDRLKCWPHKTIAWVENLTTIYDFINFISVQSALIDEHQFKMHSKRSVLCCLVDDRRLDAEILMEMSHATGIWIIAKHWTFAEVKLRFRDLFWFSCCSRNTAKKKKKTKRIMNRHCQPSRSFLTAQTKIKNKTNLKEKCSRKKNRENHAIFFSISFQVTTFVYTFTIFDRHSFMPILYHFNYTQKREFNRVLVS